MAVGAPVSESDLIAITLQGLSDDYESFIDSTMLCISSTSLDELHGLLINKELFMNRKRSLLPFLSLNLFRLMHLNILSLKPFFFPHHKVMLHQILVALTIVAKVITGVITIVATTLVVTIGVIT
ncbi:hypothetical protein ACFX10_006411 [Malus domestica]